MPACHQPCAVTAFLTATPQSASTMHSSCVFSSGAVVPFECMCMLLGYSPVLIYFTSGAVPG